MAQDFTQHYFPSLRALICFFISDFNIIFIQRSLLSRQAANDDCWVFLSQKSPEESFVGRINVWIYWSHYHQQQQFQKNGPSAADFILFVLQTQSFWKSAVSGQTSDLKPIIIKLYSTATISEDFSIKSEVAGFSPLIRFCIDPQ